MYNMQSYSGINQNLKPFDKKHIIPHYYYFKGYFTKQWIGFYDNVTFMWETT